MSFSMEIETSKTLTCLPILIFESFKKYIQHLFPAVHRQASDIDSKRQGILATTSSFMQLRSSEQPWTRLVCLNRLHVWLIGITWAFQCFQLNYKAQNVSETWTYIWIVVMTALNIPCTHNHNQSGRSWYLQWQFLPIRIFSGWSCKYGEYVWVTAVTNLCKPTFSLASIYRRGHF